MLWDITTIGIVHPSTTKQMGPTTEFTINSGQSQQKYDGQSSVEDIKAFQHARNMTGVVGDSKWHDDVKVNELWDKLSVPEPNGTKTK